jgi:hypothetical protein
MKITKGQLEQIIEKELSQLNEFSMSHVGTVDDSPFGQALSLFDEYAKRFPSAEANELEAALKAEDLPAAIQAVGQLYKKEKNALHLSIIRSVEAAFRGDGEQTMGEEQVQEVKIMRSEIDKLILEEYEDYEFLTEVRKPVKEASMRIAKTRVKEIIQEELDRANAVEEGILDKIKAGVGKLTKTPDASERSPHGDLYDVWVGVGDEIKAVNERFFKIVAEDYYYVLDLLKDADDPNGKIWQEDDEDSGYAPDLRFPKLTGNQQDAIGSIGRVERDIHRLIRTTAAGDESYSDNAVWKELTDYKYFDFIVRWVKELERPVDYTGMP